MSVTGHLDTYNHVVVVTENLEECNKAWAELFGYEPPEIFDTKQYFDWVDYNLYKTLYRGKNWHGDMTQCVVFQKQYLLELKQPGTEDCLREFYEAHGQGIPYFGIVEGSNRNAFVNRMVQDYGCDLVHDQKYPGRGDWCLLDTEKLLGCRLCVKEDGYVNDPKPPMMDDFHEMTIVVPDINVASENWKSVFGIDSIKVEKITDEYIYQKQKKRMEIKAAEITDGVFPIHLIEQEEQCLLQTVSRRQCSGIHHVSLKMDELQKNEFLKNAKEKLNVQVLEEYDLFGEHYIILDSLKTLGTFLGIICK